MPLEHANTIEQLDNRWPLGTDGADDGDDHIRVIKNVLKKQFPGSSGQGFSKPITITEDQLNDIPGMLYTVNSIVLRLDDVNPATIYGGTWALITGDACLSFGDGSILDGLPYGENEVKPPLPKHRHQIKGAEHSHDRGTMDITGSFAVDDLSTNLTTGAFTSQKTPNNYGSHGLELGYTMTFKASRSWTGRTSKELKDLETDDAGVEADQLNMNVRGARIAVNVWVRTA